MTLAYDVVGRGPHLTFPTAFPLVGIDHTLGNRHIEFRWYTTFDAGFGKHKAQIVPSGYAGRRRPARRW